MNINLNSKCYCLQFFFSLHVIFSSVIIGEWPAYSTDVGLVVSGSRLFIFIGTPYFVLDKTVHFCQSEGLNILKKSGLVLNKILFFLWQNISSKFRNTPNTVCRFKCETGSASIFCKFEKLRFRLLKLFTLTRIRTGQTILAYRYALKRSQNICRENMQE